ncbi:MAG TPA: phosphoribosyltransferase family protein [Acidimicrobiia bacterium]|nr:phosphoribosyltransferase family protein [Acidimicrobiia bacterium]
MADASPSGSRMLADAIVERGRVEGSLVKVDDFLNHRVEPDLMRAIGSAIAEPYGESRLDLVLTAEASGIAPAVAVADHLGVACVYAKKYPRRASERPAYAREVASPTKQADYRVEVAHRVLPPGASVLIVDDFLSRGRTAEALGEIVEEAGGSVVGFGFAIEKGYMEGRSRLESRGWRVESLVIVTDLIPALRLKVAGEGAGLVVPTD